MFFSGQSGSKFGGLILSLEYKILSLTLVSDQQHVKITYSIVNLTVGMASKVKLARLHEFKVT